MRERESEIPVLEHSGRHSLGASRSRNEIQEGREPIGGRGDGREPICFNRRGGSRSVAVDDRWPWRRELIYFNTE
uniref:Uncharacterized protein n=1 Tax=Fagus sylvatica TaxID=28930 RepID=A0A2N9FEL6_FAGSY